MCYVKHKLSTRWPPLKALVPLTLENLPSVRQMSHFSLVQLKSFYQMKNQVVHNTIQSHHLPQ